MHLFRSGRWVVCVCNQDVAFQYGIRSGFMSVLYGSVTLVAYVYVALVHVTSSSGRFPTCSILSRDIASALI